MSQPADKNPIPADLLQAVRDAIVELEDWDRGGPLQPITLQGKPYDIAGICSLVMGFAGVAPQDVIDALNHLAQQFRHGQEGLSHPCKGPENDAWPSVARCLRELFAARKARFEASSS